MTTPLEYTTSAQERALEALRQSQIAVVEAIGVWAKAVETAAPNLPAVPAVKGLPSYDEIVETNFEFANKVLKAQHDFAKEAGKAAAPVIKTTSDDPA